jgi:hypothetical protein
MAAATYLWAPRTQHHQAAQVSCPSWYLGEGTQLQPMKFACWFLRRTGHSTQQNPGRRQVAGDGTELDRRGISRTAVETSHLHGTILHCHVLLVEVLDWRPCSLLLRDCCIVGLLSGHSSPLNGKHLLLLLLLLLLWLQC